MKSHRRFIFLNFTFCRKYFIFNNVVIAKDIPIFRVLVGSGLYEGQQWDDLILYLRMIPFVWFPCKMDLKTAT